MIGDLSVELIHATVQLEQPLGDGTRTVGTGFLINAPTPDGKPRTVLITANHVFERMPSADARVGYRTANPDGSWSYSPQTLTIRDAKGAELWTRHPSRDVAAISITAPPEFAKAAIPLNWLADDDTFTRNAVSAGDEMMALGFPRGLSANQAGFPILRSGRVASYPVAPARIFPTFLLDFSVFPGNSGGPVFVTGQSYRRKLAQSADAAAVDAAQGGSGGGETQFIAGLLTQQVELNKERLEIGIVTHAKFIREAIALLDGVQPPAQVVRQDAGVAGGKTASAEEAASPE